MTSAPADISAALPEYQSIKELMAHGCSGVQIQAGFTYAAREMADPMRIWIECILITLHSEFL